MKRLNQLLVVDVESTCWNGAPPSGQTSEIIEIGVCAVDLHTLERGGRESILVRPKYSKVSDFCTGLTTLTQADVDRGVSLADACSVLRVKYRSESCVWGSYGNYDRKCFERQCRERGVAYPFGPTHLNIKNLFAMACGLGHEVGMDKALELLRVPLEGTHHRGHDDAWNIAGIFIAIMAELRASPLGGVHGHDQLGVA